MLKEVFKIDKDGYIVDKLVVEFDEQTKPIKEFAENIIAVDIPQGLYRPKWDGTKWVETMTEEEYIATLPEQPQEPTIEDRISAVEDVILNLL